MGTISIGGKVIHHTGGSVSIVGDKVYIDGVERTGDEPLTGVVEVRIIEGSIGSLHSDNAVIVDRGVTIAGNVEAGNSVTCGDVQGNVKAGNSVNCGDVGGDVSAGNSIRRK